MRKKHAVLLIDLGSASASVAFATIRKDGNAVLSHVKRSSFKNASGENTGSISELALSSLKESLAGLRGKGILPVEAHIILAAPWYSAHIAHITSSSQKALKIGKGTVERAIEDYKEKTPRAAAGLNVESAVSQAYVNGYPTALKRSVHGNILTLALYESAADQPLLKNIAEAIRSEFPSARPHYHSFPFVSFTTLRDFQDEQGFLIIDVGGEITDIAVVSRGGLYFVGSFPIGSRSIVRSIAGKGSLADAASRISLFAKNELSENEAATFQTVFEKTLAPWMSAYNKLLGEAALGSPIPHTVFLASEKEDLSWLTFALSGMNSSASFRTIPLVPNFFQEKVLLGEEGIYDAFLSIGALYTLQIRK